MGQAAEQCLSVLSSRAQGASHWWGPDSPGPQVTHVDGRYLEEEASRRLPVFPRNPAPLQCGPSGSLAARDLPPPIMGRKKEVGLKTSASLSLEEGFPPVQ